MTKSEVSTLAGIAAGRLGCGCFGADEGGANNDHWSRAEIKADLIRREGEFYAGYLEEVHSRPELVSVL